MRLLQKKELIRFWINRMQLECKVHIKNHTISDFAALMDEVENTESTATAIQKAATSKKPIPNPSNKPPSSKHRKEVTVIESTCHEKKNLPIPPEIPISRERIGASVQAWIEDKEIQIKANKKPAPEETGYLKFYLFIKW